MPYTFTLRWKEHANTKMRKYLNSLPGQAKTAYYVGSETKDGKIVLDFKSSYIGRAEVSYMLDKRWWEYVARNEVAELKGKIKEKFPNKDLAFLISICEDLASTTKLKSEYALKKAWEQYYVDRDWKKLLNTTGFNKSIWGWTGDAFPPGVEAKWKTLLVITTADDPEGKPYTNSAGETIYQRKERVLESLDCEFNAGGGTAIGPLTAMMITFSKKSSYAKIQAGNSAAAQASGFLSGDGQKEQENDSIRAGNVTADLQTVNDDQLAIQALEGAQGAEILANPDSTEPLSEEEKIQRVKFQTQCLLAANVREIANFSKTVRSEEAPAYEKTYMLEGEPYKLINKLTYKKGSGAFADITVPEASSLVPMIRLEKMEYNAKGQYLKSIPIVFDTFTNIEDVLAANSGGRSGVGIKSFDWQYNGTNIATVKSDITAKLVLYFQTFNDLLAYNHLGFRYVDLLMRSEPPRGENSSIAGPNADKERISTNANHDSKHFEIKATVGWAYNNDYILDYENKKNLEEGLRSQRATLFLTLVEHEFDIEQDGTFTLSIDYRARLDGLFMEKRADVLLTPKAKEELCKKNKELEEAQLDCLDEKEAKLKKEIASNKDVYAFQTSTQIMDELLTTGRIYYGKLSKALLMEYDYDVFEIPASKLELTNAENKLMAADEDMITRLQDQAIREIASNYGEELRELGYHTVDMSECGLMAGVGYAAGGFFRALDAGLGSLYDVPQGTIAKTEDGAGQELSCFTAGAAASFNNPNAMKEIRDISYDPEGLEKVGLHKIPQANGDLMIPYFFLGDLIDIAAKKALSFENMGTEDACNAYLNPARSDNLGILLGSLNVRALGKSSTGSTSRDTLVNIGDIPVALEYFRDFWARRVTKRKRTTYPLNSFIKDCLRDFGMRALGEECFDERPLNLQIKDATICLPAVKNGGHHYNPIWSRIVATKALTTPFAPSLKMSRLNMGTITSEDPLNITELSNRQQIQDTYHYKLFYLQNKSASNMTGNKAVDEKNGIIHLGIGEDRGLLKNISFKRANFPGLRETRVLEQDGFNPLSHLADVYSVEVQMIGNTIFYPGQYIYVNPLGFGAKLGLPQSRSSASRAMGLGGYHLITQVSSYIESGKFETTVTALWETSGGPGARRNDRGESTGNSGCSTQQDLNGSAPATPGVVATDTPMSIHLPEDK